MGSDKLYGLRTVSRIGVFRQVSIPPTTVGDPPTLALLPIPLPSAPTQISINPNEEELELPDVNCKGEEVIGLTITKGFKPELQMEFPEGIPEMDSFIHGRLVASKTNQTGFVFFETTTVDGITAIAARNDGEIGYEVIAQPASETSQVYYIDPLTKLAKNIEIVGTSATPTGDQIKIGAHLAITISPELAELGVNLRGWIPCTFAKATVITAESLGLLSVYGMGVDFGGRFANLIARNCSRRPGGQFSSDPKRQVNLRILPDPNDGNGLGYQIKYTNQKVVC